MTSNIFKGRHTLPIVVAGVFVMAVSVFLFAPSIANAATYSVQSYNENTYTAVDDDFIQGETVYGKGIKTGGGDEHHRLEFKYPNGSSALICGERDGKWTKCSYDLANDATTGTWTIELQQRGDIHWYWDWGWHSYYDWNTKKTDTFNVTAAAICGNDKVEGSETCDEGEGLNGDPNHCNSTCSGITTPVCGNDVKESGEQCDGDKGCSESCTWEPATISAKKVVCDNEDNLPNSGVSGYLATIDINTAQNWVDTHDGCKLVDWTFQWRPDNNLKPGDPDYNPGDNSGVAGSIWSDPFSTSIDISASQSKIWLREVWNSDYIPFTYSDYNNNSNNESAEFYCSTDVLNYDNLEWIDSLQPGQDYYCVGFNALPAPTTGSLTVCKYDEHENPLHWNMTVVDQDGDDADETWNTATNSETGCVTLDGMDFGSYLVSEEQVSGWKQLDPNNDGTWGDILVNINGENLNPEVYFMNEEIPTYNLEGFKWNDLDGDGDYYDCANLKSGALMSCEQKLAGWTIFIDKNGDGILNNEEANTLTDEDGWYHFGDLLAGTYSICEVQQAGWSQTFPTSPVCHTVTLPHTNKGDTCSMKTTVLFGLPSTPEIESLPMCNFGNKEMPKVPDISISKSVDKATANEGDTLTYTVSVKNTGNGDMGSLVVTDTLPTNTTFVSADNGGTYDDTTKLITWTIASVPATNQVDVTYTATVNSGLPIGTTAIDNIATINCNNIKDTASMITLSTCPFPDGKDSNKVTTTVTKGETLTPVITFTLTKKVDKTIANPNDTLSYTLVVTNTGNTEATNVTLTDTLPSGLTYLDANGVNTGETTKTWTWATLAAGASQTVTYKTHVDSNATAKSYVNSATVKADGVPGVTAQATSEVRTPTVLGEETATLAITKTAKEKTVNPGGTITFTVIVTNTGTTPALNVTLTDTLPQGMVFADNNTINHTWDLGDLVPTESVTRTYEVKVDSGTLPGKYVNTATAKADSTVSVSAQANVEVIAGTVLGEETDIVPTVTTLPSTGGLGLLPSLIAGLSILGSGLVLAKRIK